jgi:hypothetical protein
VYLSGKPTKFRMLKHQIAAQTHSEIMERLYSGNLYLSGKIPFFRCESLGSQHESTSRPWGCSILATGISMASILNLRARVSDRSVKVIRDHRDVAF